MQSIDMCNRGEMMMGNGSQAKWLAGRRRPQQQQTKAKMTQATRMSRKCAHGVAAHNGHRQYRDFELCSYLFYAH